MNYIRVRLGGAAFYSFFGVVLRFVGAAFFGVRGGRREGRGKQHHPKGEGETEISTTQRVRREEVERRRPHNPRGESSTTQKKEEGLPLFLTLLYIK